MTLDQSTDDSKPFPQVSGLQQHLVTPMLPSVPKPKSCGRVLTSSENIKAMEAKEEKKKALLCEKEEKQNFCLARKQQKYEKQTAKPSKREHVSI